jgi:hypothetical protein
MNGDHAQETSRGQQKENFKMLAQLVPGGKINCLLSSIELEDHSAEGLFIGGARGLMFASPTSVIKSKNHHTN